MNLTNERLNELSTIHGADSGILEEAIKETAEMAREILSLRGQLAELRGQEPVAWIVGSEEIDDFKCGREVMVMRDGDEDELEKIALYALPLPPAASQPVATNYRNGIEAAAKWIDKQREAFDNEHGRHDPDTGTFEFGNDAQLEHSSTLAELSEGIRALQPSAASHPVLSDELPGGLKYSSALPEFEDDSNIVKAYHCYVHGVTRSVPTQEQAYADAKAICAAISQPYTVPDGDHENSDVVFSYKCPGCGKRPIIKHSKECSNYQEETVIQSDTLPYNGVTAEHQRVIEMLLKVCGAAFELADDTCECELDGEQCITAPSDSFAKLSDALDEIENNLPTEDADRPDVFLAWAAMPRAALKSLLQSANSPVWIGIDWAKGCEPGNSPAIPDGSVPEALRVIGNNINTQDNRVTSDPLFCVFQKREMVTDADYDHDRIVWWHSDGYEASETKRRRLELLHNDMRDTGEWRRLTVKEIDDFVTACFTEKGCKDYLTHNGHNLRQPFIYVMSGYRNTEYQTVRNWLSAAAPQHKGE